MGSQISPIIFGADIELGIELEGIKGEPNELELRDNHLGKKLPVYAYNGGYIYVDMNHPEICPPEVKNAREAVVYEKAMEQVCLEVFGSELKPKLYKNTRDAYGNTFGAHESYFVKVHPEQQHVFLVPSIIEKLWTGAGHIGNDGSFQISQRADYIDYAISGNATEGRGVLNTRDEKLGNVPGHYRIHHISNDSNRCEVALFLKRGVKQLFFLLHEQKKLPAIPFKKECAAAALKALSIQDNNWKLIGTETEHESALRVARIYYTAAFNELRGASNEIDEIIDFWGDVLTGLEHIETDPTGLVGKLDWVTRRHICRLHSDDKNCRLQDNPVLEVSLDYDLLGQDSIFYWMQENAWIKRVTTDSEIIHARTTPPETRAQARAAIIRKVWDKKNLAEKIKVILPWTGCQVFKFDRGYVGEQLWQKDMPNPFCTYPEIISELEAELEKRGITTPSI
ncbi:proteasome accessory factor PafA2 family protein [Candidatus Pacearchaeota archaeon]|nr:proteasome accessory factor PafA2 family protein [Candidatus Pacearchaeota archaeon]